MHDDNLRIRDAPRGRQHALGVIAVRHDCDRGAQDKAREPSQLCARRRERELFAVDIHHERESRAHPDERRQQSLRETLAAVNRVRSEAIHDRAEIAIGAEVRSSRSPVRKTPVGKVQFRPPNGRMRGGVELVRTLGVPRNHMDIVQAAIEFPQPAAAASLSRWKNL